MTSPLIGIRVWNIKFFFVYCDVITTIANWFHCLVFYYVAPVNYMCCELPDEMSIQMRNRCLSPGDLRRGPASIRFLGLGLESHRQHGCLSLLNVVCC